MRQDLPPLRKLRGGPGDGIAWVLPEGESTLRGQQDGWVYIYELDDATGDLWFTGESYPYFDFDVFDRERARYCGDAPVPDAITVPSWPQEAGR